VAKLADAADLGSELTEPESTGGGETSPIDDPGRGEIGRAEGAVGQSWGNPDPVEVALAEAITKASAAGRFDVVALLARELEARRTARAATNVVPLLDADRRRRR
jgi:hypothetical protein